MKLNKLRTRFSYHRRKKQRNTASKRANALAKKKCKKLSSCVSLFFVQLFAKLHRRAQKKKNKKLFYSRLVSEANNERKFKKKLQHENSLSENKLKKLQKNTYMPLSLFRCL